MSNSLTRIVKEPLVQFLFLGACIYIAYGVFGAPEEDGRDTTISVDAGRIEAFITEWQSRWNRPPTQEEIDGLIQNFVREELLYRQAVAMGLGENDPITRRRMAQKLEFLTTDLAQAVQPAEGELEQYFEDNIERYQQPAQISFVQVFFDPDRRDDATLDDAEKSLTDLKTKGVPDPETLEAGDQSILQNYFPTSEAFQIRRVMGSGFAESVMKLEAGKWHGPVLSGYGVHLVYVFEFQEGQPLAFADVEDRVLEAWHEERAVQFNADFLETLRKQYDIVIDDIPAERLMQRPGESAAAIDDTVAKEGGKL